MIKKLKLNNSNFTAFSIIRFIKREVVLSNGFFRWRNILLFCRSLFRGKSRIFLSGSLIWLPPRNIQILPLQNSLVTLAEIHIHHKNPKCFNAWYLETFKISNLSTSERTVHYVCFFDNHFHSFIANSRSC